MSNPDSSTPSIQALNLAVKPAGYSSWEAFEAHIGISQPSRHIALAYAADLDKADKVGREIKRAVDCYRMTGERSQLDTASSEASSLRLPEAIDPDLLEAAKDAHVQLFGSYMPDQDSSNITILMNLARRGRELAKERAE